MNPTVTRRSGWVLAVVVGLALLTLIALASGGTARLLDPEDRGPTGGRALAQVLRDHGVRVDVARSIDEVEGLGPDADTTVLVADPEYLGYTSGQDLSFLAEDAARVVLVDPRADQLEAMGLPLSSSPLGGTVRLDATCEDPEVRSGDTLDRVDVRLVPLGPDGPLSAAPAGTRLCFPLPGGGDDEFGGGALMATVAAEQTGGAETVAIGFGTALTNRYVDDRAHAGLAVRLLGSTDRLVWYQPGIGDLAEDGSATGRPGPSPWPAWLGPASALLVVGVVVLALTRGRRLGRLVTEPLPVVVRAVETTESRGRLYRRARDTDRASAVLRAGTRTRLAQRLAVDPADRDALLEAVTRTSGLTADRVTDLLDGPAPTTDGDLVSLATSLTDLEERVHPS